MKKSLIALSLTGCVILLSACSGGVMDPKGPVGSAQKLMLLNSVFIMLCIVVPVIIASLAIPWWFRASNTKATYRPKWAYSGRLEVITWSIPIMVILFLGGITWIGSHDLDPYKALESDQEPIDVQVISLDWKWLFVYPDQNIASVNHLVIPAGVPVKFHITSGSVMTAFFIPQLGSMIYSMNGMETQLNLMADDPGEFHGLASHYSGAGFSGMEFKTEAMKQSDFDSWVASVKGDDARLDRKAFDELAKQETIVDRKLYSSVMPGLFSALVTQKIPPSAGPPDAIHPITKLPAVQ